MPESFKMAVESGGMKDLAAEVKDTAKALLDAAKADAELQRQVKQNRAQKFPTGPNQKLLDLDLHQQRLDLLPSGARREAIAKDLPILRFRADRSRILGEKRLAQGDAALHSPGLLDLFQELNGLLKARSLGQGIGAGVRMLSSVGGINNQRRVSLGGSALGGGAGGAALSAAEMGGPMALAVGATVTALGVFAHAVYETSGLIRQAGDAATVSGGTGGNISRLGAMGVAPGQVPGAAGTLRQRLETDQLAQVTAAQMGVRYPGPQAYVRDQNNARILEGVLVGLRKITDQEERLRKARILGVEAMLPLLQVSERVFQAQMREAQEREKLFDPKTTQAARDLTAQVDLFGSHAQDLSTALLKPLIPDSERMMSGLNNIAGGTVKAIDHIGGAVKGLVGLSLLLNPALGIPAAIAYMAGGGGTTAHDANTAATDANTKALMYVAAMLQANDANMGGSQANGAVPPGVAWNPNYQAQQDWTNWRGNRDAGPW